MNVMNVVQIWKKINNTVAAKTSGKGSSNFNSSASTFPAAPVQKLSDVKDP